VVLKHHSFVNTPHFCKRDHVPPDFTGYIVLLYISSDQGIQPEDGLTRRGRNM